jgi:nitroreductase
MSEHDLFETMATMRAMRRLKPDAVPADLLRRLVEAATLAPSGGNLQQHHYVVVTERARMAALAEIWRRAVGLYLGQVSVPPDHVDAERYERQLAAIRYQAGHFEDTPALIAACYRERTAVRSRGQLPRALRRLGVRGTVRAARSRKRAVWLSEAASVYPGVENLLLAARALGLGATMTLWHLPFEHEVAAALELPADVHVFALIPVGYPLGRFGPVRRRPLDDVLHWQRYGGPA